MKKTIRNHNNPLIGSKLRFIELAEDNNKSTVFEVSLAPRIENKLNYFTYHDKKVTCILGTVTIEINKEKYELHPDEYFVIASETSHYIFNGTDEKIVFKVEITPAAVSIENMLMISYGLGRVTQCYKNKITFKEEAFLNHYNENSSSEFKSKSSENEELFSQLIDEFRYEII